MPHHCDLNMDNQMSTSSAIAMLHHYDLNMDEMSTNRVTSNAPPLSTNSVIAMPHHCQETVS